MIIMTILGTSLRQFVLIEYVNSARSCVTCNMKPVAELLLCYRYG